MAYTQINVGMNVDGVITGTDKAKRKISELGGAARDAGRGTGAIGDGMAATSQKVESATRNMIASIQRQTAALESGSKASREYQESLARSRGIDTSALRPYLDQLDSVREKQERAAQSAEVMKSAGVAAGVAAAAMAAALAASVKSAIDTADQFSKMAAKTGVAVEALRELNYAASLSDVSTEALGSNMQKLSLNMAKAAGGSKEQAEVFKAMGVSVKDASGQLKNAGSFVEELAGKFANYADGPEKAALAMQIFGESGAAMIPLLNSGAQGLKDMAKEANELGTVFSGDMAKQAEAFNDSLTRIQTLTQGAGIAIATELLPTLNLLTKTFLESAKEGKGFGADLASGARVAVEAFVVLYSDVEFVLKAIGREIGAIAAQLVALGKLDFAGFTAISDAVKEDGVRARAELDKFQRDVLNARFQTSTAGAGRGTAADPRILGDIPSLQTAAPVINKTTAAVKALGDAFASQRAAAAEWAKYVGEFAKYAAEADAKAIGLTKTQAKLVEYLGSTAYTEMGEPARQLALEAAYAAIATEQLTEATKAQLKAMDDAHKAATAYAASLDKIALADADVVEMASAYADSVAERVRATEFEAGLIGQSNAQRAVALKQYQIEVDLQKQILSIKQKMASEDEQAKAIAAVTASAQKAKANAAAEVVNAEFERVSQQIEQDLTDALMRGFESGKGFAEVLRDTTVNMFKTMVLRPSIQATVQGGMQSLGFGGPSGAGGASSGNALGAGFSLAGGYNSFATSSLGQNLGLSQSIDFGTGYEQVAMTEMGTQVASLANSADTFLGYANALNTAFSRNAQGGKDYGAAAGQALGMYLGGPIGSKIGGEIGKALGLVDYGGTYHTGGIGGYSAAGGTKTGAAALAGGMSFGLAPKDYSAAGEAAAAGFAKGIVSVLDSTAVKFGKTAGYEVTTAFADDISPDSAWGALFIKQGDKTIADWKNGNDQWPGREFADGDAGLKEYTAAVTKQVRDLLIEQTPEWADTMLQALGDAPTLENLSTVVAQINAAASALDSMGKASAAFATLTDEATSALIKGMGGAEAAIAQLSGYYDNFYSEAERTALATAEVSAALGKLGVEMPATRDAFRSMVDAALAAGDTALASNMLNLSGAFASVTKSSTELAAEATAAADQLKRAADAAAEAAAKATEQARQAAEQAAASALSTANAAMDAADQRVKAFFDQFSSSIDDAASVIGGASQSIKSYLDGLNAQASGTVGLRNAQAAFGSQLALAKGGDREALSGITNYADRLLGAIASNARTASEAAIQQARVKAQLAALPGQVSAEELIVNAIERQTFNLAGNLTSNFTKLDANVDGLLTFEELQAAGLASDGKIGDVIAALDRNGDGQISVLEALAGTLAAKFDQLDTTLDGVISFDEFRTAFSGLASDTTLQSIFRELDVNGDGVISRIEASNVNTAATVSGLSALTQSLGGQLAAGFGSIDLSGNGLVDYAEFRNAFAGMATDASLQAIFRELDVNGDGTITRLEAIRGSSGETASNTYGLDKLTRISDVINSLQWGTDEWNTASVRALSTVAQQQGWTADDMSKALGRFSGPEIAEFFAKYGGTVAVGGLNGGGASAPGTLNTGGSSGAGAFTAGGGGGVSIASGTAAKYSNSMGIGIYDPAAVDRLDSINGYVNSMNWGADAAASAWATYQSAQAFGVTQQELAVSTGYSVADIQALFDSAGVPRFAAGGMHSGGLRLVGENGPELEVTGPARYMNTAETMSLLRSGGANNTELLAEMRAMREDNQAQARAMVQLQQRIVKLQERWDANGLPSTRIEA